MHQNRNRVCTPLDTRLASARNREGYNLRKANDKQIGETVNRILQQGGHQCTEAMEVFVSRDQHGTVKWMGEIVFRFIVPEKPVVSKNIAAWHPHLLTLAETVDLESRYE